MLFLGLSATAFDSTEDDPPEFLGSTGIGQSGWIWTRIRTPDWRQQGIVTLFDFCNRSREAVEFPDYPESTFDLYREFESELFADDSSLWWTDPTTAKEDVTQRWLRWRNGFGRRRGNRTKKEVLDILSYESKAAFHQCYSSLWLEILPHLMADQTNQEISHRFHALWHLDHRIAHPRQRHIHLLHGLVLGLHPAFGKLLTTETGTRLIGAAVAAPEDTPAQERFLHAGLISLYLYAAARRFRCTAVF